MKSDLVCYSYLVRIIVFLAVGTVKACRPELPKYLPQFDGWPGSPHRQHGFSYTGQQETKDRR